MFDIMAYPQLGYPYSPTHPFLMSTSSLANCLEPGGRSLLDSGVMPPSPQPLRCPVYESRLLGSPGQEIPTPAIGLGVYGAGYGKSQGYYGTCGGDATALYARGTLESKDGAAAHVGASQTPAYYPYDYAFGQYPYDRYGYGSSVDSAAARRKNATRETTSTLKAWLQEHQKNPYPTKGEKIMLAIITKMTLTQVSTWFANARRRLKKENKVTWGRSAEDRDGRIFSSDNEDEPEKHGSEDEEEEEIDLESIDIDKVEENPGDQREVEGEGKLAARDASDSGSLESQRTMSVKALRSMEGPISLIKAPVGDCKNAVDLSPNAPVCQRPPQNKPKIWSLAETATSPDSSIKPSPAVSIAHQATIPSHHPALLPGHGIYTCQIGKQLHNWANAAFLSANSLLGVRSLLGAANPSGHHMPLHGALNHQDARLTQASGASCTEEESGDESLESFSPKRDDDVNIRRSGSPKSPFQLITDRSHHGTAQRALSTISTI